jgi:hypothetical protein
MAERINPMVLYEATCTGCVRTWHVKTGIDPKEYGVRCVCGSGLQLEKSKIQPK